MPLSIKPFLIALFLLALHTPAYAQQSYEFVFGKIEALSNATKVHNLESLYHIELIKDRKHTESSITASELVPIAKFMGLQRPEDLAGKPFSSHLSDPFAALDYLRMQALHNGNYSPPTPDQFFDQLAKGLVSNGQGGCPRAKDIADSHTISLSMKTAFPNECQAMDPKFLTEFKSRIEKFSNGRMSVAIASSKELNGIAAMCAAEYFFLELDKWTIAKFMFVSGGFVCTKEW